MRRGSLISAIVALLVAPSAFAQQVLSPYGEVVISPYGDEPAPTARPVAPVPPGAPVEALPPVPPPVVVPPPPAYYPPPPQPYYYRYQQPYPQQYAQPGYVQAPRVFHEELQPRYGLMVTGLVILGASWSINAATAYFADEWKLAVPVIGPFMETSNIYTGRGYEENRAVVGLLVFDGLIETAGAIMLVAGAVTHHRVRVYDQPRVSVVPTAGVGSAGLAAFGRF